MTHPHRKQRGVSAVTLLAFMAGTLGVVAYAVDATRMTADAAQLKRATDAAALAVTMAYVRDDTVDTQALAERYVSTNLGLDTAQLRNALTVSLEQVTQNDARGYRVSATFQARPTLLKGNDANVTVSSAAVALYKSLEVALALPNTLNENANNLAALRRMGKQFARDIVADRDNAWVSLVPYSQSVNVYDPNQVNRIRNWASAGALNPVELTSLFRTGYGSLADRRIPDRIANLLCVYRGLNQGENYFWQQAPGGAFKIYYRADLPINGSPGATPISWIGPNPSFGQANGANDTRYMVADRGCPDAALLPLTNNLTDIDARLDKMSTRFNVNYAIAMGWAAMSLAPAFRGGDGWGLDDDLPKDFDEGSNDRLKAIVFLVNSTNQRWFDTDAYNAYVGTAIDGGSDDAGVTRRFANLCNSLRARNLKFYLLVTGNDEAEDEDGQVASASDFRRIAGTGLTNCSSQSGDQHYLQGADFVASEGAMADYLDDIAQDLRQQSSYVKLIE